MNNPLISIIVPVYKVELYLKACIDSIVAQTYTNLEIILVDDGSPDKCPEICDEYAKHDNRIKVIHLKNGGLSAARNAGIDIAKGLYLSFVDSDDVLHPEFVESLFHPISLQNRCISVCAFRPFYKNNIGDLTCARKSVRLASLESLLEQNSCMNTFLSMECNSACNKLFSADLFKSIRFPKGRLYEDVATTHKLLFDAEFIYYVPMQLYNYRVRDDSIMGSPVFSERYLDFIFFLHETIAWFENKGFPQYAKFYYPALLMPEMYAWWGLKHVIRNKDLAKDMLEKYRQDVKLAVPTKYFSKNKLLLFKVLGKMPFVYEVYRKIMPGKVGGR